MAEPAYPEHDKLREVQDETLMLGEFLMEWCEQRGLALCRLAESGRRSSRGPEEQWFPVDVHPLLGEFFGIDMQRIDAEKNAMLDAIRSTSC